MVFLKKKYMLNSHWATLKKGHAKVVLKLKKKRKKALYDLKQAPRAWNSRINKFFQENEFLKCTNEGCIIY